MVCPWRPLNSDVLFRWSGERLSLLTLSACFSGTSKGYGLVKYASKACSIQARHVLEGCHLTSCVRANTLYFSRQNTAVWFLIIRLRVSMTQLPSHTFAHLTGSSFRLNAKLLPNKKNLGLKYTWVNSVKKWPSF